MIPTQTSPITYPECDGLPMADNTKQLGWMFVFIGNLRALFHDRDDVFVGGNQNWYPVEGHPEVCLAPDAYAVFGRPKGDRGSYKQWEEGNVPMTVVFEILSPGNTYQEMIDKHLFYDEHGVEEYYVYDPDSNRLQAYLRRGEQLLVHRIVKEFVSPRLGIRFVPGEPELKVFHPDGRPFLTFEELEAERLRAEERAEVAEERAEQAGQQIRRLAQLSRAARLGQATAEELAELERLEGEGLA